MEIRKVMPGEEDEISKIYAQSWKSAYRGIVPQAYLDELSEYRWSPKLKTSAYTAFTVIENGNYIGASSFAKARGESMSGWGEIISIYLLPEYWGQGYGRALLSAVMEELTRMGFQKIFLWVLFENTRARKFYERNGFRCTEDRSVINVGGKDLTEIRYVYTRESS